MAHQSYGSEGCTKSVRARLPRFCTSRSRTTPGLHRAMFTSENKYTQAVEAARNANNPKTWKEVNVACIQAEQFRCAEMAGMHIIVHPDHLEELIVQYEKHVSFETLINLSDSGLKSERSHFGMYTELGIMYAKYKPEKLMDFIKLNTTKLNTPKLIQACERHYHWEHAVILYTQSDEFDAAVNTMIGSQMRLSVSHFCSKMS